MNIENHTVIPFSTIPTNHFIIEGRFNDTFARFILDTGAGKCCMSLNKAAEMNLIIEESNHTAAGVGEGYMERFEVTVPQMSIGDWQVENFAVAGLDLSGVNRALGSIGEGRVDGIIGADILLNYNAVMDYESLQITLKNQVSFESLLSNHVVIEVDLLNGDSIEKSRFIIDTGAGQTCIDIQKAEKLDWALKKMEEKATGIGSASMPISTTLIPKISLGDFDIFEYNMTIIDLNHVNNAFAEMDIKPVDGIIGADVLLQYGGVIDCGEKMLYLKI